MLKGKSAKKSEVQEAPLLPQPERQNHSRIIAGSECSRCLNSVQLMNLEQSFRDWSLVAARSDVRLSRQRILLIFLLIRYSGARLNEVLALDPFQDIDLERQMVTFNRSGTGPDRPTREVQLPETLTREIRVSLDNADFKESLGNLFQVDPGHVRRKFYERLQPAAFPKSWEGRTRSGAPGP